MTTPRCFGSNPNHQAQAENDCCTCAYKIRCSPLEYRHSNMDTRPFPATQADLAKSLDKGTLLRAIPNYDHNQVLIVGGRPGFSEADAIRKCRELSAHV